MYEIDTNLFTKGDLPYNSLPPWFERQQVKAFVPIKRKASKSSLAVNKLPNLETSSPSDWHSLKRIAPMLFPLP
jgi:hypothetical protein